MRRGSPGAGLARRAARKLRGIDRKESRTSYRLDTEPALSLEDAVRESYPEVKLPSLSGAFRPCQAR